MKILIQGYSTCCQNEAGGVQGRITNFVKSLSDNGIICKLFNYWEDNISDYDIVHFFKLHHDHYHLMNYARKKNVPIVLSTIIPLEKKMWIKSNLLLNRISHLHNIIEFNKKMLDWSSAMLTQSEAESKFISSAYGIDSSKIHAIPNGVSLSKFVIGEELIRNHLKCYSDFVLSVGRFDENKNQLSIIRALKNKPIPIVFIGGPDPFSLEYYERCKEEATDNMYFLGWLSHDDPLLVSAYVAAKVVVLASYKETFGNVILEGGLYGSNLAISKGIPILDYNNLRKECFTFNPNDIMDIEIQIELAYNSPVNSSIKKIIADNFTWDAVAKTHISIYESLLSH